MKPDSSMSSRSLVDVLSCFRQRMSSGSMTSPYPSDHFSAAASYKGVFTRREVAHRASKELPSTPKRQSLSLLQPQFACYIAVDCSRWHPYRRVVFVVIDIYFDDS